MDDRHTDSILEELIGIVTRNIWKDRVARDVVDSVNEALEYEYDTTATRHEHYYNDELRESVHVSWFRTDGSDYTMITKRYSNGSMSSDIVKLKK